MNIKLLSIITPVYKNEKTVAKDVSDLKRALLKTPYNFEIIVVVDGTLLDKSFENAKKVASSKVKVFGYKTNKGKGQAVRYGMSKAKGDVVGFIDTGGDINPQGIIMALEHMKWYGADVIIGSKLHSASVVKNYSGFRKLLTYGYYLFVKTLFQMNVRDTQTGLKFFKREVLEAVLDKLVIKRFAFDMEILAVCSRLGYKIYDAPVFVDFSTAPSTVVNKSLLISVFQFVSDTLAVWYRMHILKYYDDGRKRVKKFDPELSMYVNTGDMVGSKQKIVNVVNNFYSIFSKNKPQI
ncbi:glycosyltransferase [bacterium]|nr:glycosyltransferase [bacterium]